MAALRCQAALLAALVLLAAVGGALAKQGICETYVVAPGDSVVSIAQKFSVSQSDLEKAISQCDSNYNPGDFLQANQRICLPPTFSACQYVRTSGDKDSCKYYIIQSGDTLETIALSLNLLRLDLEKINPQASTLQVNQFVKLTGWSDSCPEPGNSESCRVYIAEGGDSLSTIAMAFSVDLGELQKVNPNLQGTDTGVIIQPGTRIAIPPFSDSCGDGVPVPKPVLGNCNAYEVLPGDTLFSVAAMFQTTTEQLVQANPSAAEGVLSPGTNVFIPPYNPEDCVNGVNMLQAGQIVYQTQSDEAAQTGAPADLPAAAAPTPAPAPAQSLRRRIA